VRVTHRSHHKAKRQPAGWEVRGPAREKAGKHSVRLKAGNGEIGLPVDLEKLAAALEPGTGDGPGRIGLRLSDDVRSLRELLTQDSDEASGSGGTVCSVETGQ
jgi:hypothetical protein